MADTADTTTTTEFQCLGRLAPVAGEENLYIAILGDDGESGELVMELKPETNEILWASLVAEDDETDLNIGRTLIGESQAGNERVRTTLMDEKRPVFHVWTTTATNRTTGESFLAGWVNRAGTAMSDRAFDAIQRLKARKAS